MFVFHWLQKHGSEVNEDGTVLHYNCYPASYSLKLYMGVIQVRVWNLEHSEGNGS